MRRFSRKYKRSLYNKLEEQAVAKETKSKKPAKKQAPKKVGGLRGFIRDTRGELRKVSWPTRREARSLTVVVVIVMVVMSLFLFFVDLGFYNLFHLIWSL